MNSRELRYLVERSIEQAMRSSKLELHLNGAPFTELESIPEEVFELTSLKILNISGGYAGTRSKITSIPPQIAKLRSLEVLILSKHQIRSLPKELFDLDRLEQLYLDKNELAEIPRELGRLKALQKLDLAHNRLTALPREIEGLTKLETLDVHGNSLSHLPFEIGGLPKLTRVTAKDNRIENIPLEILNQSSDAIINYCKSILAEEVVRLHEAKLLIVGEGGVGKTCLLKRIVYNSFSDNEATTEGIDIQRWNISTDPIDSFRVNIWDFGGQEIYHATHQFFLTKRSLYLFVWTARNDEVNFEYWLNIIKLLSGSSPVILVLNKVDERIKMLDEHLISKRFPNVVAFHRVSALGNIGIAELIRDITSKIVSLEHVGNLLPRVWVQIRERLEHLDKHHIEYREYKAICHEYKLDDMRADLLSRYYHDLGVFLHFQDNPILKSIVFLKPEWATGAVYKIVDTKEVVRNYGKFHFDQLKVIWTDYPEEKHLHLVELMKKFELCFQIPESHEYIIPELLQPSTPTLEWNYERNLRFEYHYEFMPSGIITRFIVINHHLIHNDVFWKNGAVFRRETTKALVISDPYNKRIQVWIDGRDRREMLSIIRETLDRIHKSLNYPNVKEMVKCVCGDCRDASDAFFFDYATLKLFVEKGKTSIPCSRSTQDVSIGELLDGIEDTKARAEDEILHSLRILRSKYDDEETLAKKANDIIELRPSFLGVGLNVNEIIKRFLKKEKKDQ